MYVYLNYSFSMEEVENASLSLTNYLIYEFYHLRRKMVFSIFFPRYIILDTGFHILKFISSKTIMENKIAVTFWINMKLFGYGAGIVRKARFNH